MECNNYDFFNTTGPHGRNTLYDLYGGDGIVAALNCLQIKFSFDPQGYLQMDWDALLGQGAREHRDQVGTDDRLANAFKVYAYLKDQCIAVAQTYDPQKPDDALPWTNRLWESDNKAPTEHNISFGSDQLLMQYNAGIQENFASIPYGAARFDAPPAGEKLYTTYDPALADSEVNKSKHKLDDTQRAGIPYSSAKLDTIAKGVNDKDSLLQARESEQTVKRGGIIEGVRRLNNIFAKVLRLWVWDKGETRTGSVAESGKYRQYDQVEPGFNLHTATDIQGTGQQLDSFTEEKKTFISNLLATDTRVASAPILLSFNPRTCQTGSTGGYPVNACKPRFANSFNIDGKDGIADDGIVFAVGSKDVALQFYASADSNQLPIKHIAVSWGDGVAGSSQENMRVTGFFRNHKPYCSKDDKTPIKICAKLTRDERRRENIRIPISGWTCQDNSDCRLAGSTDTYECVSTDNQLEFGNIPQACEQNYFSFEHSFVYDDSCGKTVSDSGLPPAIQQQLRQFNLTPSDKVCVFRPRVMIIDNWGMCNGECGLGENLRGCYGDESSVVGADKICNFNNNNAGTTFHGRVIIAKPRE
jgi:hypothetical protein